MLSTVLDITNLTIRFVIGLVGTAVTDPEVCKRVPDEISGAEVVAGCCGGDDGGGLRTGEVVGTGVVAVVDLVVATAFAVTVVVTVGSAVTVAVAVTVVRHGCFRCVGCASVCWDEMR
jgi:hypothetical protein